MFLADSIPGLSKTINNQGIEFEFEVIQIHYCQFQRGMNMSKKILLIAVTLVIAVAGIIAAVVS
jgi:hypothetical protein